MQTSRIRATWPFQALADNTRFRVCRLIAGSGESIAPGTLSNVLGVLPSHLSKHLQILETAGLVRSIQNGRLRKIEALTGQGVNDSIFSAVLSSDDFETVLGKDWVNLLPFIQFNSD